MKSARLRLALGVALMAGLSMTALGAEEGMKTLPTLLIKGEVVSVDTTDPSATLLKVKDRYGFETPIYLGSDAKIMQGDAAFELSKLAAGTAVEVEYNFDVNTAKRHAVSVKVNAPAATAAAPAAPAQVPPVPAMPSAPAPAAPSAPADQPAASNASTPMTPAPQGEAAPATAQ